MELRITSKEIIKPSSPTPHHLRTYKLSLIDQVVPDVYFSIILFYSKTCRNTIETSNHLKQSLSNTLTHYYPLAGRRKDQFSIYCDDYGASFTEAHIACQMSNVLMQPEIDLLEQLLPFETHERLSTHLNLNVQVNYFGCGGIAMGICFKHAMLDASSAAHFVKSWAAIACGSANAVKDVISDHSSIFPGQDLSGLLDRNSKEYSSLRAESITKRFTFDGTKIASLKEKFENGTALDRPTRFEVVLAIIFGALIAVVRESGITTFQYLAAIVAVNLRPKMGPPFPPQCMGNIISGAELIWPIEKKVDYSALVRELRQAIKMVDDQSARKLFGGGGGFIDYLKDPGEIFFKTRRIGFTSWCRFPYYEADFGWGKPMWVATGMRHNNFVILIDSCDGEGIEAWLGLPKEDMAKVEEDPGILKYASFMGASTLHRVRQCTRFSPQENGELHQR